MLVATFLTSYTIGNRFGLTSGKLSFSVQQFLFNKNSLDVQHYKRSVEHLKTTNSYKAPILLHDYLIETFKSSEILI